MQRKEDEASQASKDAVNHDDGASANQVTSATILNIANIMIRITRQSWSAICPADMSCIVRSGTRETSGT
jgi:hypothetical protein